MRERIGNSQNLIVGHKNVAATFCIEQRPAVCVFQLTLPNLHSNIIALLVSLHLCEWINIPFGVVSEAGE